MSDKLYVYNAEAHLDDGSAVLLDLEERGWADKELLNRTVRWVLVPKDGAVTTNGNPLPFVVVNIPEGAKPVFKSRVYANAKYGPMFRIYGIGYFLKKQTYIHWVLPTGDIEIGEDSWLADIYHTNLLASLKAQGEAAKAAEEAAQAAD